MKNIFKNPYSFYRRKNCLYDKENIFFMFSNSEIYLLINICRDFIFSYKGFEISTKICLNFAWTYKIMTIEIYFGIFRIHFMEYFY